MSTAASTLPVSRARAILLASRPRTLPAAASPVVVGSAVALAEHGFRPGPALAALFGALMIQVGTNYANDVLDFEKGTDTHERVGPLRVTQAGLLTPRAVKLGAAISFALATLAGVYLAAVAGWPVVAIGIASILAGIAYTGGPFPLAYNGLGDVFVMIFFGFVAVTGTVFVQLGRVTPLAWWSALAIGALATAIIVVNNTRDLATDAKAGRRTIPVRFGRTAGLVEYVLLLAVAAAVPLALVLTRRAHPWLLLPLGTVPSGVRLALELARTEGPALNRTLGGTAKLEMLYALLFSVGLVIPALGG